MKILCIIDCQNDFITGSLGSPEAQAIVPKVVDKIRKFKDENIVITKDTHFDNYLTDTLEGKILPVKHCICNTLGHKINNEIYQMLEEKEKLCNIKIYDIIKNTFGYCNWAEKIYDIINFSAIKESELEIELCGLCTDICVVSNALALRMFFPNVHISVDATCCAGTAVEAHEAALKVMESCQIEVINDQN